MKRSDLTFTVPDSLIDKPGVREWLEAVRNKIVDDYGDQFDIATEQSIDAMLGGMIYGTTVQRDPKDVAQDIVDKKLRRTV